MGKGMLAYLVNIKLRYIVQWTYSWDPASTFDIDSLSMSLNTMSFWILSNVPWYMLIGIRTNIATIVIGKKIFKLPRHKKKKKKTANQHQSRQSCAKKNESVIF